MPRLFNLAINSESVLILGSQAALACSGLGSVLRSSKGYLRFYPKQFQKLIRQAQEPLLRYEMLKTYMDFS